MMEGLIISGLAVPSRIGIHEWEQRILQTLLIDIEIPYAIADCQDSLELTVDYARLCFFVESYLGAHSFRLIETVANSLLKELAKAFNLKALSVAVSKPNALKNVNNVSVKVSYLSGV